MSNSGWDMGWVAKAIHRSIAYISRLAGAKSGYSEEHGVAAVEFALVLPAMCAMFFGMISLGIAISNYEILTGAVNQGVRALALSRGSATPFADTVGAITTAAPGLKPANLGISMTINGQACASDSGQSNCASLLTAGGVGTVHVTYPCSIVVMGYDFSPGCTLTQTSTGRVE